MISRWLDGAASSLARVLEKLCPDEQEGFLKAVNLLETELPAMLGLTGARHNASRCDVTDRTRHRVYNSPRERAVTTASTRFRASSFCKTLRR